MKLGWAYLALSVLFVLLGVYVSLIQELWVGDLLLVVAIGLIFLGSKKLADANAGEKLTERAK